jgi:hypothetical protein
MDGFYAMDKDASQTRDYCVAKGATQRAARSDPSAKQKRSPQDDNFIPKSKGALKDASDCDT